MKRTKKGRPSKADLAAAEKSSKAAAAERELRRSGRRRNVRYTFDFDDYLDDEEYFFVEEEEDERRREKKIKLLLKLHSAKTTSDSPSSRRHEMLSLASSLSVSDDDEPDDNKALKKRRVNNAEIEDEDNEIDSGKGNSDEEEEEEEENNYDQINDGDDEVKQEKMQEVTNVVDYVPGGEFSSECPLPDKKHLDVILHKLQKKDIYGVYAEPVDPEELPDYHDLIENPMDFSTIRSKLSNGSYATLEQFESDVFLLCSNAMQYNEPDTVYHRQAKSIQELAKRKFQKLRVDNERLENQMKSEQKPKPVSVFKKQIPRQTSRPFQEPIGSDTQNGSNVRQADVIEKTSSLDVLVEGNRFVIDTSVDKLGESLTERGPLPRYGRKAPTQDECRATNSIGSQPNASSDSAFSTFDGETKQLIPVGLHVEYAYARSLSRFAGTLGPVAWRVASKRIEQILPPGTNFGRGWVGEFEPLPTPVQIPDNCNIESDFIVNPQYTDNPSKHERFANPVASRDSCVSALPLEGRLKFTRPPLTEVTTSSSENSIREEPSIRGSNLDGKLSFPSSKGTTISGSISPFLHPNPQMSHLVESSKKVMKPAELIGPFSANHNSAQLGTERQVLGKAEAPMPNLSEMISANRNPRPPSSFKQSNINGAAFGSLRTDNPLLNGRAVNYAAVGSKEPFLCSEMNKEGPYMLHGQEPALNDPVQLMKMLTEKNKNQQYPANQSAFSCPPVSSVAQSLNRENSSNAAADVDRSWMSMGSGDLRPSVDNMGMQRNQIPADPLYNAALPQQSHFSRFRGDFPAPLVYFQPGKNNYPFHGASQQPVRAGSAVQFYNQSMVVPQMSPADLSRLQAQSPWRNPSPPTQQPQKQGTCPPDLNVSFQSASSPGRPSPGVPVDSRQPDLALQL